VGVAFLAYLASTSDVYTLTEAKTAAGGNDQYSPRSSGTGPAMVFGGVWTLNTQASGSTVTTTAAAAQSGLYVHVDGIELSDGYDYVKLASTGAGVITAFLVDLKVQRKPSNLPSVIA